ncbi:Transmembrane domain-containing protein [Orpheovirus IHUMI-LCC2]|uniref:Transmembrane domain-containing protein n=1 Tax=Orpheovirus IHUMI-LCC2 TaxID=2023057 RepID=A0A2I2L4D2_9VIRU|nr:Transmembrane domain-containing protein [Orpheovirus IHUMI-LCC2]SNW62371.1 Transmembrane domain-containing protein [Orpheovirus IHUMI-LCC2]
MWKVGVLIISSGACFSKCISNHKKQRNEEINIRNTYIKNEYRNGGYRNNNPYILHYRLDKEKGEYAFPLSFFDFRNEKVDPLYINSDKGGLSVPVGGSSSIVKHKLYSCLCRNLLLDVGRNVKFMPSKDTLIGIKTKVLPYSMAIQYIKDNYNVDITKYEVTSANIMIKKGRKLSDLYFYGKDVDGKFNAELVSDNLDYMVKCKTHQYIMPYAILGSILLYAGLRRGFRL